MPQGIAESRRPYFLLALVLPLATAAQTRDQVDALLKAKWNAMKTALMQNDVEGAIPHFCPMEQPRYRSMFTAVGTNLGQVASDMRDIELISLYEGEAKYRPLRTQLYGGQMVTLTYYVYFLQDNAGVWCIRDF